MKLKSSAALKEQMVTKTLSPNMKLRSGAGPKEKQENRNEQTASDEDVGFPTNYFELETLSSVRGDHSPLKTLQTS